MPATLTHKSLAASIEKKKSKIASLGAELVEHRRQLKELQEQKKALPAPAKPAKKTKATPAPT